MSPTNRPSMPWSIRLVLLVVLAVAGTFVWSKRPLVSDAEKACNVTKLSACPQPESSLIGNDCKIAWLEHSMWNFSRLAGMPRGSEPGGGDVLRGLARSAGLLACAEADVVDREFERWQQQAEEAKRRSAEQEAEYTPTSETREESPAKRVTGVVKSEAPAVDGPLDPSLVTKEVRARIGAIKACYERSLKKRPDLFGKVKVRWTITAAGTVSAVEIEEDSVGDSEVSSCIKGRVSRWRFPAPSGGAVDVVYPFVFEVKKETSR
jgi:TonB family protein